MGRRAQIFQLLAGENVDGCQVDLGVTVLARLGGGHVDNLAGALLDADEAVLPQSRALHGVGGGGASIGGLKGVLMLERSQIVLASASTHRKGYARDDARGANNPRRLASLAGYNQRKVANLTYLRIIRHFRLKTRGEWNKREEKKGRREWKAAMWPKCKV